MSIKKSIYLFSILSLLAAPLGFLIRIFYSQTLSLSDFGLIYAIISFFTILSIFVEIGLDRSILYYFPKYKEKKEWDKIRNGFFSIYLILIVTNILLFCFTFIFLNYLALNYFKLIGIKSIIVIFLLYFILNNLLIPVSQFFLVFDKIIYSQLVYILRMFLILTTSILIFYLNLDNLVFYYSLSWFFVLLFFFLFYFIILFKQFPFLTEKMPKLDLKLTKRFLHYGLYGTFNGIGNMIIAQIDIIILTYFFTTSQVGLYSNAVSTISIIFLILTPISVLFLPLFSEYQEKKDYNMMNLIINILYNYGFYLFFPISLIFFLFPEQIIVLLFSESFIEGSLFLQIFALFSIFKVLFQYNVNFMNGIGLIKQTTFITFAVAIFNIIFDIVFVSILGIWGIALITGVSWLLLFILSFFYLKRELNTDINLINILKSVLLNVLFIFTVILLKIIVLTKYYYLNVIVILGLSFLIYFILGYLWKIYTINEIVDFLPDRIKTKVNIVHKKYFSFLE